MDKDELVVFPLLAFGAILNTFLFLLSSVHLSLRQVTAMQ
jgi:hypothetical protein